MFALALRAARLADVDLREDSSERSASLAVVTPLGAWLVDDGSQLVAHVFSVQRPQTLQRMPTYWGWVQWSQPA